jgi:NAD(P)-dependent dehydrogenase (short-subunit alcohol dehydrogenase family)
MTASLNIHGVAVVTGAAGGIGAGIARKFVKAGTKVALIDRDEEGLKQIRNELSSFGEVRAFPLDLTQSDHIGPTLDQVETDLGAIRILINNAGLGDMRPALDFDVQSFDRLYQVNQRAVFFVAMEAGKRMIATGDGGRIINLGSTAAIRAIDGNTVYGMTKAAVVFFSEALAKEWKQHRINVHCINPGYIDTPMNKPVWESEYGKNVLRNLPRGRVGTTQDVAEAVIFLASEEAQYMNGVVMSVDDGVRHEFQF